MKKLFTKFILLLISIFDLLIPKKAEYVVYNSYPDLSDNSFALFLHIMENYPKKKNIWLLKTMGNKQAQNMIHAYSHKTNYKLVNRDSAIGIWYYLRSKYVFYTHGLFIGSRISRNHCVVNLWHGMPLKNIGLMDKDNIDIKSSYTIASSQFYQKIMSQSLGLEINQVLAAGQPRIDLLSRNMYSIEKLGIDRRKNQKIILWTPTYRKSVVGDIRSDGNITNELPLMDNNRLEELQSILKKLNAFLIVKLHPMDVLNDKTFPEYKKLKILKSKDLETLNMQLYTLMADVDVLLTDFSSIYIDFLYLDRPIGFVFDDLENYSNSRGFVFPDPINYMPGAIITNFEEFKLFLDSTIGKKQDDYKKKRKKVHLKINTHFENYCHQLLSCLKFS